MVSSWPALIAQAQNRGLHATGMTQYFLTHCAAAQYVCSKGGPLAVTDANLVLGRLVPDYFPKIFGKSEKEPLDIEASKSSFTVLAKQINENQEKQLELDEIVYGSVSSHYPCIFTLCLTLAVQIHQGCQ